VPATTRRIDSPSRSASSQARCGPRAATSLVARWAKGAAATSRSASARASTISSSRATTRHTSPISWARAAEKRSPVSNISIAFDATRQLEQRFRQTEAWERMGIDPDAVGRALDAHNPPEQQQFQTMLFSKIVPECKKLGLLDASGGWLRERFTETGVIQFEDWVDTGEEYALLDEVSRDRDAQSA